MVVSGESGPLTQSIRRIAFKSCEFVNSPPDADLSVC